MFFLFTATINGRQYRSGDKKEFEHHLEQAKRSGHEIEDEEKRLLDEMDLEQLQVLDNLTGSRDTDTTPSGARAIKAALEEAEEDEF